MQNSVSPADLKYENPSEKLPERTCQRACELWLHKSIVLKKLTDLLNRGFQGKGPIWDWPTSLSRWRNDPCSRTGWKGSLKIITMHWIMSYVPGTVQSALHAYLLGSTQLTTTTKLLFLHYRSGNWGSGKQGYQPWSTHSQAAETGLELAEIPECSKGKELGGRPHCGQHGKPTTKAGKESGQVSRRERTLSCRVSYKEGKGENSIRWGGPFPTLVLWISACQFYWILCSKIAPSKRTFLQWWKCYISSTVATSHMRQWSIWNAQVRIPEGRVGVCHTQHSIPSPLARAWHTVTAQ